MVKDKGLLGAKQSTLDKCAQPGGSTSIHGKSEQEGKGRDNAALLAAIMQSRDMPDVKIRVVGLDISLLRQDLDKGVDRIVEAEKRASGVADSVATLQQSMTKLTDAIKELVEKEDSEGCAHHNKFVGFPGVCEGPLMEHFLDQWLCSFLPLGAL
ncbi:hypothetical protein NDU88_003615 [Pleurodeles waltl]|uniref:Uncharacterized protein n=1 Tax=Pleurodeles waltl TaxID=8319 RepID=A0AAV7REE9_PLEWA|nr:hypothetical protein NDU88_003615 [Pleurodeles waltl]